MGQIDHQFHFNADRYIASLEKRIEGKKNFITRLRDGGFDSELAFFPSEQKREAFKDDVLKKMEGELLEMEEYLVKEKVRYDKRKKEKGVEN